MIVRALFLLLFAAVPAVAEIDLAIRGGIVHTVSGDPIVNGVVLIEHVRHLRKRGISAHEAVYQGALDRLRPVSSISDAVVSNGSVWTLPESSIPVS